MDKCEFRLRLRNLDVTVDEYAALVGTTAKTVYDWGARSPVPYHARLIIQLLEERGGLHGLLGRETVCRDLGRPHGA